MNYLGTYSDDKYIIIIVTKSNGIGEASPQRNDYLCSLNYLVGNQEKAGVTDIMG